MADTLDNAPAIVFLDQGVDTAASLLGKLKEAVNGDSTPLQEYAVNHLGPGIVSAAIGLVIIFVGYLVAKYVSRLISQPIRNRVDETLGRFLGKMTFYVILLGVGGAVLSALGAPLGGLAAILAAAGFAVGLAFQGTLSNFASGVLMMVFRPFRVGDVISAAGVTGKVNEIDLFTTTLDTPDNRRIIVPNSSISSGTIENISYHPHRRVEVSVGVDYEADLDQTRRSLEAAVAAFDDVIVQGDNRGSAVVLANLGDSAVDWKVRAWVDADNYWMMQEALTSEVKRQLDAVSISIPFPQLDVHLNQESLDQVIDRPRQRPSRREANSMPISKVS